MKRLLLFAVLFVASPASAKEYTHSGTLAPFEAKTMEIDIPPNHNLDVYAVGDKEKIDCYWENSAGQIMKNLEKVNICRAFTKGEQVHLKITTTNCEKKEIDYRVHIYKQ